VKAYAQREGLKRGMCVVKAAPLGEGHHKIKVRGLSVGNCVEGW
jgi:hypothetical protein